MNIISPPSPLGVLHLLGIRCPKLTCINLMVPTQLGGFLKWRNTYPFMIFEMMRPKSMEGFCTWIKNADSGGNGIRNVIQDLPIGTCSPK
jgi:hypothetical protein